jgi:hypothetical protein
MNVFTKLLDQTPSAISEQIDRLQVTLISDFSGENAISKGSLKIALLWPAGAFAFLGTGLLASWFNV